MKRHPERGMVTAELATVLPFGVALVGLLVWSIGLGWNQVRLTDAAREAARQVARGATIDAATDLARDLAPDGSRVRIVERDGRVRVTVELRRGPNLSATSVAAIE